MYYLIYGISLLARILIAMLFVQAILSWFVNPYRTDPRSFIFKLYVFLTKITQPMVAPVRKFMMRFNTGPMDFSLFLTMLIILAAERILIRVLTMFL